MKNSHHSLDAGEAVVSVAIKVGGRDGGTTLCGQVSKVVCLERNVEIGVGELGIVDTAAVDGCAAAVVDGLGLGTDGKLDGIHGEVALHATVEERRGVGLHVVDETTSTAGGNPAVVVIVAIQNAEFKCVEGGDLAELPHGGGLVQGVGVELAKDNSSGQEGGGGAGGAAAGVADGVEDVGQALGSGVAAKGGGEMALHATIVHHGALGAGLAHDGARVQGNDRVAVVGVHQGDLLEEDALARLGGCAARVGGRLGGQAEALDPVLYMVAVLSELVADDLGGKSVGRVGDAVGLDVMVERRGAVAVVKTRLVGHRLVLSGAGGDLVGLLGTLS